MTHSDPHEDVLFLALTRQQLKFGVSVETFVLNVMIVAMLVNFTSNPFMMLLCIPIHLCFYFICSYDPYFFTYLRKKMEHKLFVAGRRLKRVSGVKGYVGS